MSCVVSLMATMTAGMGASSCMAITTPVIDAGFVNEIAGVSTPSSMTTVSTRSGTTSAGSGVTILAGLLSWAGVSVLSAVGDRVVFVGLERTKFTRAVGREMPIESASTMSIIL